MVSHHLITYARQAAAGKFGASFYNQERGSAGEEAERRSA
jgi:hypothetical protein